MNQQLKQKIKIEALKYVAHIPLQTTILVCGGLVSYGQQADANHDLGNWLAYGVPSQTSLFQPAVDQTEIEQERPLAYAVMVPHST